MADVNAKDLTQKSAAATTDNLILFDATSNAGSRITAHNFAYSRVGYINKGTSISISGKLSAVGDWIKQNYSASAWIYARVGAVTENGPFGSSSFSIEANLSSPNYGWAILRSDNPHFGGMIIGRLSADWTWYTVSAGTMNNPNGFGESQTITYGGKTWNFYKSGQFVYFNATDDATSFPAGFTIIGTLNEAFRPSAVVRFGPQNTTRSAWVELYANGDVRVYNSTAITGASNFAFTGCYMANT